MHSLYHARNDMPINKSKESTSITAVVHQKAIIFRRMALLLRFRDAATSESKHSFAVKRLHGAKGVIADNEFINCNL